MGQFHPPISIRTVEGNTIITSVTKEEAKNKNIKAGDVILSVDGEDIESRRKRLSSLVAFSTPQALNWRLNGMLLSGDKNTKVKLKIKNEKGKTYEVELTRSGYRQRTVRGTPVFSVLPDGYGYMDLARLTIPQVDEAFELVKDTPAIIFDMRGYPHGTAWVIAPRLAEKKTAVARFQRPELHALMPDQPSIKMFYQYTEPASGKWRYTGKIVVLIDENAISQAEHTCMFLESVADVTFIGSPTNGANGDVTATILPGGITTTFTGHDVRHADGRQLQRVGIQPDIRIEPTIKGIRKGKDEVLERAIAELKKEN
jgi:C-terminal processing protease CtpA/Prc